MKNIFNWAKPRALRVDPLRLPSRLCYQADARDSVKTVFFRSKGVCIFESYAGNVIGLPKFYDKKSLKAVVAQTLVVENARQTSKSRTIALFLMVESGKGAHFSLPLLLSCDLQQIFWDWCQWSSLYQIPMFLQQGEGGFCHISKKGHKSFQPSAKQSESVLRLLRD